MGSTGGGGKVKETQTEKTNAEIGASQWDRFKQDFAPQEADFIATVTELGSERERDAIAGRGISELRQKSGEVQPGPAGALLGRSLATAKGAETLRTATDQQGFARKAQGMNTAIGFGRNIAQDQLGRIGQSAQLAANAGIADAQADLVKQQGFNEAIGTGIGAYGSYKLFGNTADDYAMGGK